jgi:hypothetical protein
MLPRVMGVVAWLMANVFQSFQAKGWAFLLRGQ